MTRLMLTGIAAVFVLAIASAVVMIANAPAQTRTTGDNPFEISAAETAQANTVGRLVLGFEPTTKGIDRN